MTWPSKLRLRQSKVWTTKGLTNRCSQPLAIPTSSFHDYNIKLCSAARFDAFTSVHLPLPSRPASLSDGFPARRIRQRWLILFSLGLTSP